MKLMKKSGKIVDFNSSKIVTSIENAADDIGVHVTAREIELFLEDITDTLKILLRNESHTSSYEVRSLVIDTLIKNGYKNISKSYILNIL